MPEWDSESLSAPHTRREIGQIEDDGFVTAYPPVSEAGGCRASESGPCMTFGEQVRRAVEVLAADPGASARFVVDYMERETGLPFGDMIGQREADEILARAGRERGCGVAAFRKVTWPICGDCFRHIEPGSTEGHLSWCPYAGDLDFPRFSG